MIEIPKWHKDMRLYQPVKSAFILEGNVHDKQLWVDEVSQTVNPKSLNRYLYDYLKNYGYDVVVVYNTIDGFHSIEGTHDFDDFKNIACISQPHAFCSNAGSGNGDAIDICLDAEAIRRAVENTDKSVAVIFELANVVSTNPEMLSDMVKDMLSTLLLASRSLTEAGSISTGQTLLNCIYYIVEKANDLPAWFYIHCPFIKTITVTKSDKGMRKGLFRQSIGGFYDAHSLSPDEEDEILEQFANLTEDFSAADMFGFISICHNMGLSVKNPKKAIDYFKYGQADSKWDDVSIDSVYAIQDALSRRVKGQENAIRQASEIIARARLGLTGIQKGSGSRPKGVLFLAGPTGTGKTELAKSIAEMIFGDESFITRFDMSEYGQSHSDQKLLGAPPGYVGYGAGGQLTNAVKEKPFNILLFDEIEKAHPTILDKFLQILDDGRMTDSFGETVYFSESLIIFTSNLGMTIPGPHGTKIPNITIDADDYASEEKKIKYAIKSFFSPELYNRIGGNIIIFDFIRSDEVIKDIVNLQLSKVKKNLLDERKIELTTDDEFVWQIIGKVKGNLENGARGISNIIEEYLVNRLPYVFAEYKTNNNCKIIIHKIDGDKLSVDVENTE